MNESRLVMNNLRKLRGDRGLSQWLTALNSRMNAGRLSLLEQGCPPTKTEIQKLTKFFDVKSCDIWPSIREKGKEDVQKKDVFFESQDL